MSERSPEDIAAALVRAHRAAMPQPEEMIENTPEGRQAAQKERHRPGFEDTVWFKMDIGRSQNADPRWILPLLCRRGHITRNEVGAIRIGGNETHFQVPRNIAERFAESIQRTANGDSEEDGVNIEASEAPRESARVHRTAGAKPAKPHHRGKKPNAGGFGGGVGGGGGGYKGADGGGYKGNKPGGGGGYKGNKGPRANDSRPGPVKTSGGATIKPKGHKDRTP